jgi:hypothetical protein
MAVSMVGPPKTDCPRVREKVIWESLYPILGSIRPHGLGRVSAEACRVPGTGQKSERFIQPLIFMFLDTT